MNGEVKIMPVALKRKRIFRMPKMQVWFQDSKPFILPEVARHSIEQYAIAMAAAQRKIEPHYADCWRFAEITIDVNFQPSICFGSSKEEITYSKDEDDCCSWVIETP